MPARNYFISGAVQGVGYRYFVQRVSAKLQVKGYVKNLDDGRVEVWAEGPEAMLTEFRDNLLTGPSMSEVKDIEELVVEQTGSYSTFRIEK